MKLIYDANSQHIPLPHLRTRKQIVSAIVLVVAAIYLFLRIEWQNVTVRDIGMTGLVAWSLLLSAQALLFLRWILHAWNDPEEVEKYASPASYIAPRYSFTALLAARHEEAVIGDTIAAISNIDYPKELMELLVIIRKDDIGTLAAAQKAIAQNTNARLVIVDDLPVNKPNQLNWGLKEATQDIVVVFDAEDQPHKDLYHIVNTVMQRDRLDVVQSGVQLVNYASRWFSALNCLEYYFWFKSALLWFAQRGVVPLGGNTVFFKRHLLLTAGGWDETCLTEDGEVGIRLSAMKARIGVVYDERHATQEETPATVRSLIAQRTRWNLGFLQIFAKGFWLRLPTLKQRVLAAYVLLLPSILAIVLLTTPILAAMSLTFHLPMIVAMLTFVPMILMLIQLGVLVIGLWQFVYSYFRRFPVLATMVMVGAIWPYFFVLAIGGVRAMVRFVSGNRLWEKTIHINAHRTAKYGA